MNSVMIAMTVATVVVMAVLALAAQVAAVAAVSVVTASPQPTKARLVAQVMAPVSVLANLRVAQPNRLLVRSLHTAPNLALVPSLLLPVTDVKGLQQHVITTSLVAVTVLSVQAVTALTAPAVAVVASATNAAVAAK
jgi:hypothetical protein